MEYAIKLETYSWTFSPFLFLDVPSRLLWQGVLLAVDLRKRMREGAVHLQQQLLPKGERSSFLCCHPLASASFLYACLPEIDGTCRNG